jgi:predicted Zn finger-like uncharacterized protein
MLAAHEDAMNVTCPQCATVFRVDPAKVPDRGVRARCSVCAGLIAVRRPPVAAPTLPRDATPAIAAPLPPPTIAAPVPPPASIPTSPPDVATPRPIAEAPRAPAPYEATDVWPTVIANTEKVEPPIPPLSPPSVPFDTLPKDSAMPPAPPPLAPLQPPSGNRFNNPFLQQDPATRARRLARALVSDLVVYHPEKRQRGLADGNLKDLFAEEIRKSWEEYVEQIGEDVASTTPYFTEALNEILAEGRALFG